MESPASASVPRVYVPVSLPDSPVPTYAVLQFLGFSPPPDTNQTVPLLHSHFPAPPSSPSPSLKLLPRSPSPLSAPPSPAPKRCSSPSDSSSNSSCEEKEKKLTSIKPSPMKKTASVSAHASLLSPGARRNVKSLPLGGTTISITHTDKDTIIHTTSSNFREVVHKLTGAPSGKKDLLPVTIPSRASIRSSSAAAGNDSDGAVSPAIRALAQINGSGLDTGSTMMRPLTSASSPTTKLLERRKSNKTLERLTMSCRNLPPLVPSPVTPLASDFEKICLPCTPTTSEGSSTVVTPAPSTPAAAPPSTALFRGMDGLPGARTLLSLESPLLQNPNQCKAMADVGSMDPTGLEVSGGRQDAQKQGLLLQAGDVCVSHFKGMQGPSLALHTPVSDAMDAQDGVTHQEVSLHDAMDIEGDNPCNGEEVVQGPTEMTDKTHDEASAIAKKSFFFHAQRPKHGDPTLLCLFPESPREPY